MLRLYRSIGTMDRSAPLPPLRYQKPTWARAAQLAHHWQLKKLAGDWKPLPYTAKRPAEGEVPLSILPACQPLAPAGAATAAVQAPGGLIQRDRLGPHALDRPVVKIAEAHVD